MDEVGGGFYYDLRHYLGIDIADVVGGKIPPALALEYVRNLPPGSATYAFLAGGEEHRGWDTQLYMMANLLDAVRENTYVLVAANSKRKPEAPKPFERPTTKTKTPEKKKLSPAQSVFAAMARREYRSGRKKDATDGGSGR